MSIHTLADLELHIGRLGHRVDDLCKFYHQKGKHPQSRHGRRKSGLKLVPSTGTFPPIPDPDIRLAQWDIPRPDLVKPSFPLAPELRIPIPRKLITSLIPYHKGKLTTVVELPRSWSIKSDQTRATFPDKLQRSFTEDFDEWYMRDMLDFVHASYRNVNEKHFNLSKDHFDENLPFWNNLWVKSLKIKDDILTPKVLDLFKGSNVDEALRGIFKGPRDLPPLGTSIKKVNLRPRPTKSNPFDP